MLPKHTVAIQIRDMRYERLCFIPIMWRNTATSVKAQVTHYTLYVNGNFISNKTANLSSTAHYSQFLATDECANHHIVDISATNICGMTGQSIIYRTQRQDQGCPTHTDTTSCTATEIPTLPATIIPVTRPVGGTRPSGYSERNHGNGELLFIITIILYAILFHSVVLLIIASGIMVVTTCLMGSL